MAAPVHERSNQELERALADGELGAKKSAIAEETLRRRDAARTGDLKLKYKFFGGFLAAIALALVSVRRLWNKRT
jgi:hypothetical protein